MASAELIAMAKLASRQTKTAYNSQIEMLLDAAYQDMGIAGVKVPEDLVPVVSQAAITYFLMHFGQPDNYADLKRSYDEQKAQLSMATGFTDWGDIDG